MNESSDFIVYQPAAPVVGATRTGQASSQTLPLTEGLWQQETLETLKMYDDKSRFSAVDSRQLSLFPLEEVPQSTRPEAQVANLKATQPRSAEQLIPHLGSLKFLGEDSLRFAKKIRDWYFPKAEPAAPPEKAREIPAPGPDGQIHDPSKTEIKADHFPGRIIYRDGGLYPAGDLQAQEKAPNYRKMPGKPVHGVGQPTREGFKDVLDHLGSKDKPVVWANMRAEAVIYIEGKPHNLRELGSMENLDLKKGASAEELEAAETRLRDQLLAKGSLTVTEEVPVLDAQGNPIKGQFTSRQREVKLTPENCQTTQDVVQDLKTQGYQVDYRRIPITDEKSPGPEGVEAMREFYNEMSAKYPADTQFVFNCHQGKGRTTTAMVTAGITKDGRGPRQLELPFDESRERAERNIQDNAHLQNLRTTVDEYKKKSQDAGGRASDLEKQAEAENDSRRKAELQEQTRKARADEAKYQENAREFTKRYALMQKYSEYVTEYGSQARTPSFEEWMKESTQVTDLQAKWTALNEMVGLQTAVA